MSVRLKKLSEQTIVITGASSGIGLVTGAILLGSSLALAVWWRADNSGNGHGQVNNENQQGE